MGKKIKAQDEPFFNPRQWHFLYSGDHAIELSWAISKHYQVETRITKKGRQLDIRCAAQHVLSASHAFTNGYRARETDEIDAPQRSENIKFWLRTFLQASKVRQEGGAE